MTAAVKEKLGRDFDTLLDAEEHEFEQKLEALIPKIKTREEFMAVLLAVTERKFSWGYVEHTDPHSYMGAILSLMDENDIGAGKENPWSAMAQALIGGISYE